MNRMKKVHLTENHPHLTCFSSEFCSLLDNGYRISFSNIESRMFGHLLDNLGQVISKDSFMDHLYENELDPPYDKIIDVKISHIRKILELTNFQILTEWGRGFILEYKQSALSAIDAKTDNLIWPIYPEVLEGAQ